MVITLSLYSGGPRLKKLVPEIILTEVLLGFLHIVQENAGIVPGNRPSLFMCSIKFIIYNHSAILWFVTLSVDK